ncbi:Transcriptional regulatory protein [[Clostridium] ultunense Esp]|uniref:Transcriptional regulatory protein n=1 Tax=[Clostridium] ultunense Esp TaxID=1288971 RepID=M1Z7H8_9FIRM|nr:Crp/Fnr family transcriptional regulator [Schnuerera ultunensis]CCQ93533.1 Transcriptional regulatory protein [[Clostridium] ultunense Esp]SHD75475.1 Transcriptional regulatory protein [[Clostridium] ultunense Esp]
MMINYLEQLSKCVLFKNVKEKELIRILEKTPHQIIEYDKDEVIAIEGDDCHSLGVILKGKVEIQKIFPSGQITTINNFKEGNIFGESLVFSDRHTYPATITAIEPSKIMYIEKTEIINLSILNSKILINFVSVLSDRILMLNERISNLSQDSLRKKISNFLLSEYKKQNNIILTFPYTRKKMAELLNIPRPSLSRELIRMRNEGIINFDRNTIKILKMNLLEDSLLE